MILDFLSLYYNPLFVNSTFCRLAILYLKTSFTKREFVSIIWVSTPETPLFILRFFLTAPTWVTKLDDRLSVDFVKVPLSCLAWVCSVVGRTTRSGGTIYVSERDRSGFPRYTYDYHSYCIRQWSGLKETIFLVLIWKHRVSLRRMLGCYKSKSSFKELCYLK